MNAPFIGHFTVHCIWKRVGRAMPVLRPYSMELVSLNKTQCWLEAATVVHRHRLTNIFCSNSLLIRSQCKIVQWQLRRQTVRHFLASLRGAHLFRWAVGLPPHWTLQTQQMGPMVDLD